MGRPTHIYDLIGQLTKLPFIEKRIDTWSQVDGMATLVRGVDGNAYEITIRPAEDTQHPKLKQRTIKKGMREMKSFKTLQAELNEAGVGLPSKVAPLDDTPEEVVKLFDSLYKEMSGPTVADSQKRIGAELKAKGYETSIKDGKFQLNKIGYDALGHKIEGQVSGA